MCKPALTQKMQSYCDTGDLFCAGGESLAIHMGYNAEYNKAAAKFVFEKLGVA